MQRLLQFAVPVLALVSYSAIAQGPPGSSRVPRRPVSRSTAQQIEAMAPSLARHAAIIFSGRVTDVSRIVPDSAAAEPLVQITFAVESSVRGLQNGVEFRLLEWPGRWQAGEHYRVGERYLIFLHAPNAAGLASPVGGNAGRFLIDSNGTIDVSSAQLLSGNGVLAFGSTPSRASDSPQPRTAFPHQGTPRGNPRVHTE